MYMLTKSRDPDTHLSMDHCKRIAGLVLALLLSGCSMTGIGINKVMTPVLDNARDAALASNDVRTFRDAAPANLFLVEGLIETEPDNERLRLNAAMLYFAYAFSFVEDGDPGYASLLYRKGFLHGRSAMLRNKKLLRDWDVPFEEFEASLEGLRKKDVPAAVWTAANWSQFVSLHLDSTAVLRDIPKVTSLLERAAELDGAYFQGLVHVMIGSLHSFRPPMMGGSPEESLASFERAFTTSKDAFLLPRYFFARFYCYRIQDVQAFQETLEAVIASDVSEDDRYQLLNLIAKDKARALLLERDELF
jgi:hypothetical protein